MWHSPFALVYDQAAPMHAAHAPHPAIAAAAAAGVEGHQQTPAGFDCQAAAAAGVTLEHSEFAVLAHGAPERVTAAALLLLLMPLPA